jgi:hypothetical protein
MPGPRSKDSKKSMGTGKALLLPNEANNMSRTMRIEPIRDRRNLDDLQGHYAKWTIIRKSLPEEIAGKRVQSYYLCRCECGIERHIKAVNLINGKSRGCGAYACRGKDRGYYNSIIGELTGAKWHSVTRGARMRNLQVTITQEDAWSLFLQQERRCAITGEPLLLDRSYQRGNASLDRIDSTQGYIPGNVWWVHKDINMMKRDLSMERFIELCKTIAERFP